MKKQAKGLGAGLGALLGEGVFEEESGSTLLPISRVEPREDQPRNRFDQAALEELADSISQHGLIQPITVRRMEDGFYQIIAGERRWRASRMAGLSEIPAHIIEAGDQEAMELALVENLQREDLNPIEEAMGFNVLIKQYGMTQEQVAKRVGRSRPAVANSLRLLNLPEDARELVSEGKVSFSQARALLELGDAAKIDSAAQIIARDGLTAREAAQLIKKMASAPKKVSAGQKNGAVTGSVDHAAVLSEKMTRSMGRRVTVTGGKNGGNVTIEFYDNDDLQELIEQLCGEIFD